MINTDVIKSVDDAELLPLECSISESGNFLALQANGMKQKETKRFTVNFVRKRNTSNLRSYEIL